MSLEAINWALNHAPIPTDKKNASSLAIVLVGLANHADVDGRNAFPAVKTLARYTRLKERAIQYALRELESLGLITPSDPDIIAAHVRRKDRRPNGWDLAIHTTHTPIHNPVHNVVHTPGDEVHPVHPAPPDEVQTPPDGVQTTTSRGAHTAPEPSLNHPGTTRAHERLRLRARTARGASSPLPPICRQCDARPSDPVSARIVWLDHARETSQLCPRCHPTALTQPTTHSDERGDLPA